jgi:REP element-mobilizing transposase RayT
MHMFRKESDFEAFERVMVEAHLRQPIRILSYCVLSNHWHFVAWPEEDGQLTDFFRRLAHIHAIRWRVSHRTVGYGQLYQGRFKNFPVQSDDQLLGLLRYVERNPLQRGWSIERNCGNGAACGRERVARRRSKHCYPLCRWNGQRTGWHASTLVCLRRN